MAAFGVKVTLITRGEILKHLDRDIVEKLMESMRKLGVEIILGRAHKLVTQNEDGGLILHLHAKEGEELKYLTAERILLAVGRPPNVDDLGLENTNIKLQNNFVAVDEYQNTSVLGVYAIGDVTGQAMLTPVAIRSGRMLSERLFNGKSGLKMRYQNIPTVIFSHPPIGTVGLSEEDAKRKYGETNILVYKSSFVNMFYALAQDEKLKLPTYFKIVCLKKGEG